MAMYGKKGKTIRAKKSGKPNFKSNPPPVAIVSSNGKGK